MITFVQVLDFIGTFAFAISGIRLASAKQFDWFGAYVVGGNGYRRRYNSRCIVGCDAGMDDRPHLFDMYGAALFWVIAFEVSDSHAQYILLV